MPEECGERGSRDFRIELVRYVLLDIAVPALRRQATKRNGILETKNEDCGYHPFPSKTSGAVRSLFSKEKTIFITGDLRYQACDQTVCFPPTSVPVKWQLQILPLDLQRSPKAIQHK
jgi:hypothetical protein